MSLTNDDNSPNDDNNFNDTSQCSHSSGEQIDSTASLSPHSSLSRGSRLTSRRRLLKNLESLTLSDVPSPHSATSGGMGRAGRVSKVPPPLEVCGASAGINNDGNSGVMGNHRSNILRNPDRNSGGRYNDRMSTGPGDLNQA